MKKKVKEVETQTKKDREEKDAFKVEIEKLKLQNIDLKENNELSFLKDIKEDIKKVKNKLKITWN